MTTTSSNNPQAPSTRSTSSGQAGSGPAKSMADLMASYKSSFKTFKKGDTVTGKIAKLTKSEVLVDIQAKTLAVVLEKERALMQTIMATLKVGDSVDVSILNPESEMGNPVVSLRRYLSNSSWNLLEEAKKSDSQISVKITDNTKGGLIAVTESGQSGFLPNSHMAASGVPVIGNSIKVRVIELNRPDNKIIFSQKLTMPKELFDKAISTLKTGDVVDVAVINVMPFGIFAATPVAGLTDSEGKDLMLDGLIHISEVAWEKVDDLAAQFSAGQKIKAKIIGFDKNTRRADLSLKQMTDDPFTKIMSEYSLDKKVSGRVINIDENGVHLELQVGIEGLIRKDKIPPTVNYEEGQKITATVSEIDKRRRKIYLLPVLLEKPLMYR